MDGWLEPGSAGFPPAPGPFSLGVRRGGWVFTSGRAPVDAVGATVGLGDIVVQARTVIDNCEAVLEHFGASLHDVVRVTAWLRRFEDYAGLNEEYRRRFRAPYPVRACVRADLLREDWLIEMEMTAVLIEVGR